MAGRVEKVRCVAAQAHLRRRIDARSAVRVESAACQTGIRRIQVVAGQTNGASGLIQASQALGVVDSAIVTESGLKVVIVVALVADGAA